MKHIIWLLLIGIVCCFTQCCKDKPHINNTDVPGLPPATQTGANTLGFLLNGVPWVPAGNNGTANLSIDFDPGIDNAVMGISGYRITNTQGIQYFGLGIIDSVNIKNPPYTITLSNTSLFRFRFYKDVNCYLLSIESETASSGFLTISKLDKVNRIIAGSFDVNLYKIGCDTIKITQGRFDMKF